MTDRNDSVSRLLQVAASGDDAARNALLDRVYDELLAIARRRMAAERADHTLQPTELVHEAYLRLVRADDEGIQWEGRFAFFHAAAEAMRRILIEHARRKGAKRRGGGRRSAIVNLPDLAARQDSEEILALDDAIERLTAWNARLGQLVRLRFYSGLGVEESARVLDVSERTVRRDWNLARAWLFRAMNEDRDT